MVRAKPSSKVAIFSQRQNTTVNSAPLMRQTAPAGAVPAAGRRAASPAATPSPKPREPDQALKVAHQRVLHVEMNIGWCPSAPATAPRREKRSEHDAHRRAGSTGQAATASIRATATSAATARAEHHRPRSDHAGHQERDDDARQHDVADCVADQRLRRSSRKVARQGAGHRRQRCRSGAGQASSCTNSEPIHVWPLSVVRSCGRFPRFHRGEHRLERRHAVVARRAGSCRHIRAPRPPSAARPRAARRRARPASVGMPRRRNIAGPPCSNSAASAVMDRLAARQRQQALAQMHAALEPIKPQAPPPERRARARTAATR